MWLYSHVLCTGVVYFFFFFKQKTSYEMRISDWSSDVCSSDLHRAWHGRQPRRGARRPRFHDLSVRPRKGNGSARNAGGRLGRLDQGTHGPRLCRVEIGRLERPRARSAAMIPVPPAIQRIPWKLIAILAGITCFGPLVLYSEEGGNCSPWAWQQGVRFLIFLGMALRTEERRVGKECVRKC